MSKAPFADIRSSSYQQWWWTPLTPRASGNWWWAEETALLQNWQLRHWCYFGSFKYSAASQLQQQLCFDQAGLGWLLIKKWKLGGFNCNQDTQSQKVRLNLGLGCLGTCLLCKKYRNVRPGLHRSLSVINWNKVNELMQQLNTEPRERITRFA